MLLLLAGIVSLLLWWWLLFIFFLLYYYITIVYSVDRSHSRVRVMRRALHCSRRTPSTGLWVGGRKRAARAAYSVVQFHARCTGCTSAAAITVTTIRGPPSSQDPRPRHHDRREMRATAIFVALAACALLVFNARADAATVDNGTYYRYAKYLLYYVPTLYLNINDHNIHVYCKLVQCGIAPPPSKKKCC